MDNESFKLKFGTRLQELRKSKKLTQEKLAETVKIDIPNLSNIERGKRFVSSETLVKLAQALNVDEKELFNFKHIKSRNELVSEIIDIIKNASDKDIIYFHKILTAYKEH